MQVRRSAIIIIKDINEGEVLYSIDENYYYVYEHWLGDELIYIGKGKGNRAYNYYDRNELWQKKVNKNRDKLRVIIKGYFKVESDALAFEYFLIKSALDSGIKLTNIKTKYTSLLKPYLKNNRLNNRSDVMNITETSDLSNNTQIASPVEKVLSHKVIATFDEIKTQLNDVKEEFSKKGFSALIVSNDSAFIDSNKKIVNDEGLSALSCDEYYLNLGGTGAYDVLITNSRSLEKSNILDNRIKLVIIDRKSKVEEEKVISLLKTNAKIFIYFNRSPFLQNCEFIGNGIMINTTNEW